MMLKNDLKPNIVVEGLFFPEAVQVLVTVPVGASIKLVPERKPSFSENPLPPGTVFSGFS